MQVRKLKAIYHTLNLFNVDIAQKCLIGECWCPSADIPQIKDALQEATVNISTSKSTLPTYRFTVKFRFDIIATISLCCEKD